MTKKVQLKTTKTARSVPAFLNSIEDEQKRRDAKKLNELFKKITKAKPVLWGTAIVGYGTYHYTYTSGREGEWMRTGFSPRKNALTIYIMPGYSFPDQEDLLSKLGPHKTGKSCLYIKRLDDIHLPTLKKIITNGWRDMQKRYPA